MKKTILPVKPISQLFPIPMVMGCEGVSAAMLLQFNHHSIKATEIMSKWPKHPNNPYKGYVGHPLLVKLGYHQTIFPAAFVPFLKQYDNRVKDGSGSSLKQLERVIDQGQPVIIYHTSLGARPFHRVFRLDNKPTRLVSTIHVTLLIGYDDTYYYYIDPLWTQLTKGIVIPSIIPNHKQIIRIKKQKLERSYNAPGQMCVFVQP